VFNRKPSEEEQALNAVITRHISEIETLSVGTEEYIATCDSLKMLMELRATTKRPALSPDQFASIAANLLGIVTILSFEKANVLTTKSLSFVPKITV
jgi:hypothetical protein